MMVVLTKGTLVLRDEVAQEEIQVPHQKSWTWLIEYCGCSYEVPASCRRNMVNKSSEIARLVYEEEQLEEGHEEEEGEKEREEVAMAPSRSGDEIFPRWLIF
jgi:hypothetical protein